VGPGENIPVASDVSPLKDISFAYDSYALDASAKATLRENADWLESSPDTNAQIEGHCDSRGTNEYNMVLGQKRANAVFEYLRSLGVSAERLSTISYGEELPLDPRENEAAWAKNRRAHFAIKQ
jgi:peptidoglycan-associated lipoprotein